MALALNDRVQQTGTANTTVSFTLSGSVVGFQSFAVIGNGNTTYYSATDATGNWEVGIGTYSTTGPTLTRTTILSSSNSNTAVTFSGTVTVFVTYPSSKSVYEDASGNVSALGTVSSGTWQGSTIGVAYGGTGVTSSSGANSVVLRDANQNIAVNRLNQSNTSTVSAAGTTVLTAASTYSQTLTGSTTQTYRMPDATTLTTGVAFEFNNNSSGLLTIQDNALATITTITSGGAIELVLLSNGTVAGTWDVHGYLPENVTWGTNALNLGTTVISNGTWQGGTIGTAYGGTGLTTFAGANNALYSTSASALAAGTLPVAAGGTGLTSLTANYIPYGNGTSAYQSSSTFTFNGTTFSAPSAVISANTSTNAVRITQTGTGNALLVEDSTNPDASPFVIDASGNVGIGTTTPTVPLNIGDSTAPAGLAITGQMISSENSSTLPILSLRVCASAGNPLIAQLTSSGTTTAPTAVGSGRGLGRNNWYGYDGSSYIQAAAIAVAVDATPGAGSMPGRITFLTSSTGSGSPTERMRINSAGNVAIGDSGSTTQTLRIAKNPTGGTEYSGSRIDGTIQSDVTADYLGFYSRPTTQATTFTLGSLTHFYANPSTFGAGSTVTNQYGFRAHSSLTGATNNYGFFSNIPAGTGDWNFYAAGTADNYFAGNMSIGTTTMDSRLRTTQSSTTAYSFIAQTPTVGLTAGNFVNMAYFTNGRSTNNDGLRIVNLRDSTGSGVGDWGTESYRIRRSVDQNDGSSGVQEEIVFGNSILGFNTGGSERMRVDASGNVGIGTASPSFKLDISGSGQQTARVVTTDTSGTNIARYSARYTGGGGGATSQIDIRAGDGYTYVLNETNSPMLLGTNNTERMRITANGGVSFGSSGTAYGTTGQALLSNGDAAPTWGTPVAAVANGAIYENSTSITSNYTFTTGKNGMSVGPITVASGATVTVPSGQRWVVL